MLGGSGFACLRKMHPEATVLSRPFRIEPGKYLGTYMGVPEKGDPNIPEYSTLNSRILVTRTPKQGTPYCRKLPY